MESGTILVVEDEALVRSLLGAMLRRGGHEMVPIGDYAEFEARLGALELHGLQAAVVDLTLPDGDGIDVVSRLRQQRPDLPVVLMSGLDGTAALARLDDTDRVEFLAKPFDRKMLLDALHRVTA